MASTEPASPDPRFAPHARRALGQMFSEVSPRYDFLNALLSLGQDRAWRRALWAEVPDTARVVLDVCCGSGASTAGLRQPARVVLGVDASGAMLELAAERHGRPFGGPHFARADAFRLPVADARVDAVIIAFGLRNLRPRPQALRELARVLRPGGTLAVLEAASPRPGPFEPIHTLYLRYAVPLIGRISPEPQAYRYLSRSILEFGDGFDLAAEMASAGLALAGERSFLFGATRLWVAKREPGPGQSATVGAANMQLATPRSAGAAALGRQRRRRDREWRLWRGVLLGLHVALAAVLAWALMVYDKLIETSNLSGGRAAGGRLVLWAALAVTVIRGLAILARIGYPPEDR